MAKKENQSQSNYTSHGGEACRHIRRNPVTGQDDYFYPLELVTEQDRITAQALGYHITRSRLGYRTFDAAMVPCKETATIHGREVFIDTPSEVQRQRYLDLIKDELNEQEEAKEDGRCMIRGAFGLKRCPVRVSNPDYVPGGDQPKTVAVSCAGCKYEPYRQAHSTIPNSTLDTEDESGETVPFEPEEPQGYHDGDRYERICRAFVAFVREHDPKLAELADLLTQEYSKSEAARILGDARTTVNYRSEKLKTLATEFLDSFLIF